VYEAAYAELRAIAAALLRSERIGHTFAPTALVHEAYLKLTGNAGKGPGTVAWADHGHFFRAAAQGMRRILIDHARARSRVKRGGEAVRVPMHDADRFKGDAVAMAAFGRDEELLAVDDAIRRLEEQDAETGEIVRLRFYGGLTEEQVGLALGLSERTVRRRWNFARAWMVGVLGCMPGST
jgi:RNA polymerase sigma factor (TIGR02999 family)